MNFNVEELIKEQLLAEYDNDEIEKMLSKATITVTGNEVNVKYANKVVDRFSIECRVFLKHIPK